MAEAFNFVFQDSQEGPYEVHFWVDGRKITSSCTCTAGEVGWQCTHRLKILFADFSALALSFIGEAQRLQTLLPHTDGWNRLLEMKERRAAQLAALRQVPPD